MHPNVYCKRMIYGSLHSPGREASSKAKGALTRHCKMINQNEWPVRSILALACTRKSLVHEWHKMELAYSRTRALQNSLRVELVPKAEAAFLSDLGERGATGKNTNKNERGPGSHRLKYRLRFIIGRINGTGIPCIPFVSVPHRSTPGPEL